MTENVSLELASPCTALRLVCTLVAAENDTAWEGREERGEGARGEELLLAVEEVEEGGCVDCGDLTVEGC